MNVFDWLSELPLTESKPFQIVEISFSQGRRKDFFKNTYGHHLYKGQMVTVESNQGYDVGMVNLSGELVRLQLKKYGVRETGDLKRILRAATDDDLRSYERQKDRELEVMIQSRAMARQLGLEMKIAEVEIQADGKKATFFYTADGRVDFRELIKVYANEFRLKVEMKQIGARQESGKVGGIGSCGRELCCSTWLSDFKTVNTGAARYQNLTINQAKLSGQCGRLKCCLNYELDTYMDALRVFPTEADTLEVTAGIAFLQKRDIFRSLMWYSFKGSNKQYPLTIQRVREIQELNRKGIKPEEIGAVELEVADKADAAADKSFVNDVGQVSLRSIDRQRKKQKSRDQRPAPNNDRVADRRPQERTPTDRPEGTPTQRRPPRPGGDQNRKPQPRPQQNAEGATSPKPNKPQERRDRPPRRQHAEKRPDNPETRPKPNTEGAE